jgi:GTPase SAR1 family protein
MEEESKKGAIGSAKKPSPEEQSSKPTCLLVVGMAGSGKTTFVNVSTPFCPFSFLSNSQSKPKMPRERNRIWLILTLRC